MYYESGQLRYEAPFKSGYQNDITKSYNEEGKLTKKILYKDGKAI